MRKLRLASSLIGFALTIVLGGWLLCPIQAPATEHNPHKPAKPKFEISADEAKKVVSDLRSKHLLFPILGFDVERVKGSYDELRGNEKHEAVDILAPRNTAVLAVDNGTVAKLFLSKLGGITIYQFDSSKKYVYYYAHLEKYVDGLRDDQVIKKGQVIGYVGTSGDAPKNTPHLHFSISLPAATGKWWQTAPVNPYLVFEK